MNHTWGRSAKRIAWLGVILSIVAVVAVAAAAIIGPLRQRPIPTATPVVPVDPDSVYDPVKAGEDLPEGYRQGLGRDQIVPVYDPVFTAASEVDWPSDMLVIGVAGTNSAKAYPVTHLNQREMVVDSLEGIPILVTW
jgi:hypothetical protein